MPASGDRQDVRQRSRLSPGGFERLRQDRFPVQEHHDPSGRQTVLQLEPETRRGPYFAPLKSWLDE